MARKGRAELLHLRTPPELTGQDYGVARTEWVPSLFLPDQCRCHGGRCASWSAEEFYQMVHGNPCPLQVGVISWGVVDVCKDKKLQVPAHARDFHINLFQVLPWLKEKLHDEDLGFL